MRIAFWGSSLVSAYWNGAATYYRGVLRALARLGHEITFFEPDAYDRQQHRDIEDPDWANIIVYNAADLNEVNRLLAASARFDVMVKASGVGVLDEYLEARASTMPHSVCKVFWDVDAPATLERLAANSADPFHRALPRFDVILTYGGGKRVTDGYRSIGARECVAIYNALDPDVHFPVEPDSRFACDLSFLGNRLPDREARVEEFFLKAARLAPDQRFLLGGSGWSDKPLPANVSYVGHVYTADHNAFNCSARLVLNISRDSMARFGFSPATRVFEAAGAGACLITDAWEGIDSFLAPGREILVAHDGAEVAGILQQLSPERARSIGQAGRKRVLAEHTYERRGVLVESILQEVVAIESGISMETLA
ncbi:MAG: glycosyltransferase [Acidobacteriaceae bacterium]|nr:glycosyltransferase [Acidobacteriaceae bacterium]MBV9780643.1 glycosyltransferase [Acidobacteriaceae bacterium]